MRHEPSALVRDPEHPMKLVRAHSLLAGTQVMKRHQPFVQGNVAVLEQGSNGHAELLVARPTVEQAAPRVGLGALLDLQARRFAQDAAMRTNGAFWPTSGFEVFPRFVRVLKVGFEKRRFHTGYYAARSTNL